LKRDLQLFRADVTVTHEDLVGDVTGPQARLLHALDRVEDGLKLLSPRIVGDHRVEGDLQGTQ
jgi:hypothetical protein